MEINYIDEFIKLVEIGNFQEAADKLYVSQSTLSRHIQSLENDLGVQLFNRTSRKVELNRFGEEFLSYAKQITALKDEYMQSISSQLELEDHLITLGVIPTMSRYHITDVLSGFQEENQDYQLKIIEADTAQLKDMLLDGTCDFAFIREYGEQESKLQRYPYFSDQLVAIIPQDHPLLSDQDSVSLSQLKLEPFLLLSEGSLMYSLAFDACKSSGFTPNVVFTGNNAENIIDLAGHGMGIGLLTRQPLAPLDTSNVRILDVVPQFVTQISLACRSEDTLSPSAWTFLKYYKSLGIK